MAEKKEIKKIAFVYSGGLARGAIQIAFAKQLIEKIGYDRLLMISASSIGALSAYSTSVKSYDKLINFYTKVDCDSTSHFIKKIRNDLFNDAFNKIEGGYEEVDNQNYIQNSTFGELPWWPSG